jgi:predicted dehydrogenase
MTMTQTFSENLPAVRVGIVGCGLIGNKRLKAIGKADRLVAAADSNLARAQQLAAAAPGAAATADWRELVRRDDVDLVVVATTNDMLAPVTLEAVRHGKHVLVEKPAARNAGEIEPVAAAAREAFERNGTIVKVGFNHRFHPAFLKARELFDAGVLGPMMFVRGRYGQGGRLGMEKEWRGTKAIAGGGEMLDQGVHLVDLSRWFLGEFASVQGSVERFFWDWEVEDNGFCLLKTAGGQVAWLHASCTEWKNTFSFEIYGRDAKLHIEGLGGSYGVERLYYYKMLPQMGPPETTIFEFPGEDRSWQVEWAHTLACIRDRKKPVGNMDDALQTLRVIDRLYDTSR